VEYVTYYHMQTKKWKNKIKNCAIRSKSTAGAILPLGQPNWLN